MVFLFLIFDIVLHIFTAALSWTSWLLIYSQTPTMGTLPLSNLHHYTPAPRSLHPQSLLLSRPPPSADNHTHHPPTPLASTTIIIILHNRHHYLHQHYHTTCPQPRCSPSSTLIFKPAIVPPLSTLSCMAATFFPHLHLRQHHHKTIHFLSITYAITVDTRSIEDGFLHWLWQQKLLPNCWRPDILLPCTKDARTSCPDTLSET